MFGIQDLSPQLPSWKLSKELAQIATGTTPTTTDSSNWDGSILWITPAEMKEDSFVITNTERKLSEKGMRSKSLSLMPIGTVLLSTRAPIGKVGIVGKEMCCNQGFKNFIFKKGVIDPVFAFWLFKMSSDYLESIGHGTTFKEISKTNAENIRIPTPPFVDQVAFSTFAKEIDKSGFVIRKQIENLQELLNSKMDEYFGQ
jgi:type I restriction enzyme S subunit